MRTLFGPIALGLIFVTGLFWGFPHYKVWQQGLAGQASLERAKQDRQIAVQEAEARLESAKLDAQAEIKRAEGSAQANEILANSLGKPNVDKYLQLRYIGMLENSRSVTREIIYVPGGNTPALPSTEAGRAVFPPTSGMVPSTQ